MGIKAQSIGVDITGSTVSVEKEMAEGPRRIGKLAVTVHAPHRLPERQIEQLKRAAYTCPVHKSMLSQVEMPIDFFWD
jgi:putative redox protein